MKVKIVATVALVLILSLVLMNIQPEGMENMQGPPVPTTWFMASNQTGPQCCKGSIFSSSNGCVCVSDEQNQFLKTRGGNRTSPD